MSDKILNTISNRRDIKISKSKNAKKSKNSRNIASSLRSGSSNSNRISKFNQYITMLSNGLPYGQRSKVSKRVGSKSNKKIKKSSSRLNSSALSVYNEHQKTLVKPTGKENHDMTLNSYCNVPISSQYQTLNNSMLGSKDFTSHFSETRHKSRSNKSRIKTTSTNSYFNAEKLLESSNKKKQTSLTRIQTFKNSNSKNNKNSGHSLNTLDSKTASRPQLDQRGIEKIKLYLEDSNNLIVRKEFQSALALLTKALKIIENNSAILWKIRGSKDQAEDLHKSYKQLASTILAMAYRKQENDPEMVEKFSDIYLARAHIYLYMKKYNSAVKDFRAFNIYAKNKTVGYLGEGDALTKLSKYQEAVN